MVLLGNSPGLPAQSADRYENYTPLILYCSRITGCTRAERNTPRESLCQPHGSQLMIRATGKNEVVNSLAHTVIVKLSVSFGVSVRTLVAALCNAN